MANSSEYGAPLELTTDADAGKKRRRNRKRLGILLAVLAVLGIGGGTAAWVFLSAPTVTPQLETQHVNKPKIKKKSKEEQEAEAAEAAALDVTSTKGRRPGQQRRRPEALGGPGAPGAPVPGQAAPALPAQAQAALPQPPTQEGAVPKNPLDVQGVTEMMASTEEMRLKTAYMKELAAFNKAQTDAVTASAALQQAQAAASGAGLTADGSGAGGGAAKQTPKKVERPKPAPVDRAASGRITGIQGRGKGLWASGRTLDGDVVRLDVGSKWNGGRISSITNNGVSVKYDDGRTQRFPF